MSARILGLLIRSERIASDQLQNICHRLAGMIRASISENLSGRIHILPERRHLVWLEYPPADVTAGIATVALFGRKWMMKKIPRIAEPTIVIECHLMPLEPEMVFEDASTTAEFLTTELTGIMADCELEIRGTRLASLLMTDQRVFILEELS